MIPGRPYGLAHAARRIISSVKSSMPLADLKHLAQKSRDRIERITARAAALDTRGDTMEATSTKVLDAHEAVIEGLEREMKDIDAFNSEMAAQLGNDGGASGKDQ